MRARALLPVLVALTAPAADAGAAVAPLAGKAACLAPAGGDEKTCAVAGAIAGPSGIAVAPDGRHAYLSARSSSTFSAFTRDAVSGALDPLQCLADAGPDLLVGGSACGDGDALDDPGHALVSPDGRFVYAAGGGALAWFRREPDGRLTQTGCIRAGAVSSRCPVVAPMWGTVAIAMSADAGVVFTAAAAGSNAVHAFRRDAATGALAHAGCVSRDDSDGSCADGEGLGLPVGVVAAPDGSRAWVATAGHQTIVTLALDGGAGLRQIDCRATVQPPGGSCRRLDGLAPPGAIAGTPDGRALVVGSSERLDVVRLDPDGLPAEVVPGPEVESSVVAVRPDGRVVAVASESSLDVFRLEDSRLERTGCAAADRADCAKAPDFGLPRQVEWSPDGQNVYVAAQNMLAAFAEPVAVAARAVRAGGGALGLRLQCPSTRRVACSGRVRLSRGDAAAAAAFRIRAGRTATVRVRVPAGLARRLARARRASIAVRVRERERLPGAVRRVLLRSAR